MTALTDLKQVILTRCFKTANEEIFVLASGKRSRYYIDLKQAMFHPPTLSLLGSVILERLRLESPFPDGAGGLTLGADPLAFSVALAAQASGLFLKPFVVRKEAKGHGTQKFIEGLVQPGDRVVVLEDVATTGGSSAMAVQRCRDFGLEVLYVLAVVDREEGARDTLARLGLTLRSLFTLSDLKE
jgi:orotate phosphoribosyltransferase